MVRGYMTGIKKVGDKSSGKKRTSSDQVFNYCTVTVSTLCTQLLKNLYLLLANSGTFELIKYG